MTFSIEQLKADFTDLHSKVNYSGTTSFSFTLFNNLEECYSRPWRHYHNLTHISNVLSVLDDMEIHERSRGSIFDETHWNLIKWAAWYHDYKQEDEVGSAFTATEYTDLEMVHKETVTKLILATNHKRVPHHYNEAILCDADLSILGSSREQFNEYEENIRQEYKHVPDELFKSARYKILEEFFNRGIFLYHTQYGRERFGLTALDNLSTSMRRLTGKKWHA